MGEKNAMKILKLSDLSFKTSPKHIFRRSIPDGESETKIQSKTKNLRSYETLLILRPDMIDEERDRQLAKFEVFLANEGAEEIDCIVKGRQRMSYPIEGHRNGVYVLFHFKATGITAKAVQKVLSNPDTETQGNIIRWANFKI